MTCIVYDEFAGLKIKDWEQVLAVVFLSFVFSGKTNSHRVLNRMTLE